MASLEDQGVDNTYKDLLQVSNSNSGVDTTLRTVSDGEGTDSALQVSTTVVGVKGSSSTTGEIQLAEDTDNGTNYMGLKAPAAVTASLSLELPDGDGTNGQTMVTNGSGVLSWSTGSGIGNVVEDTTPQLGGQLDVNGNAIGDGTRELITFTEDASAVNHVNIENQATGSGPIIQAAGDDAAVDLVLKPKGTGEIKISGGSIELDTTEGIKDGGGDELLMFVEDTTPVNYFQMTSGDTGVDVILDATGSDANVGMDINAKGTGTVDVTAAALTVNNGATGPGEARLLEDSDNGTNYMGFKAPSAVTSSLSLELPNGDGSNGQVMTTNGSGVLAWSAASGATGTLESVQVFTAGGTWTKPGGITQVVVEVQGAGGGGGGTNNATHVGGAGGAGGYAIEFIDVSGTSSETVTIGAAGAAGSTSGGAGGNGGTSSFGSLTSATGGTGGGAGTTGGVNGGAGGAGSGGTVNIDGARADATASTQSGNGAASRWGAGGAGFRGAGAGLDGTGYGAGGSPSAQATSSAGGAGTAGLVIVWEYA